MAPPILNLADSSLWIKAYDTTLTAQSTFVGNSFYPIPIHKIPVIFNSHTLAIGSSSSQTKPTWRLGFYLTSEIQIPGIGKAEATSDYIWLGLNLIRIPPLGSTYTLKARIPKWHREMVIAIWKYIGSESDTLDVLNEIKNQL